MERFLEGPKTEEGVPQGDRKIQAIEKRLKKAEESLAGGDGSSGGTSSTGEMSVDEQRIVAATINGVMAASRHNATNGDIQFPTNGRSARSIQGVRSGASISSEVTFDHLGNPV